VTRYHPETTAAPPRRAKLGSVPYDGTVPTVKVAVTSASSSTRLRNTQFVIKESAASYQRAIQSNLMQPLRQPSMS
jgi:hypothetical protein